MSCQPCPVLAAWSQCPPAGPPTSASLSKQTPFPATPHGQPVQISLQPDTSGHHCLSARTIYTFGYPKYSKFSEPTCFFLEAPGGCKSGTEVGTFPLGLRIFIIWWLRAQV